MKPGIYSISNEQYHASDGISRSAIMEFKKSPFHYWHKYKNPDYIKPKESAALKFGSAMHCYLLEPHMFDEFYVVEEKISRRSKEGKEQYAKMIKRNHGKTILSLDEFKQIQDMAYRLSLNSENNELLKGGKNEQSIYWIDPDTQILCKVRPDVWHEKFVVDYKTISNASEFSFQHSIHSYGYYLQAAMTAEAFKHALNQELLAFIFIAQETSDPYLNAIYQLDQAAIDHGIQEFKSILHEIKRCQENNVYHGYKTKIISLPSWSLRNEY